MQYCYVLTFDEYEGDGFNILGVFASYPTKEVLVSKLSKILEEPTFYMDQLLSGGYICTDNYEIMLVKKVLE